MKRSTCFLALWWAYSTSAAVAQVVAAPGSRVRVTRVDNTTVIGELMSFTDQGLRVAAPSGQMRIARYDVGQLEISLGSRGSRARAGALIGGTVGAVAGGVLAAATWSEPRSCAPNNFGFGCPYEPSKTTTIILGTVLGGTLVGGVGALIGHGAAVEVWSEARLPRSQAMDLALTGTPSMDFGLRIRW